MQLANSTKENANLKVRLQRENEAANEKTPSKTNCSCIATKEEESVSQLIEESTYIHGIETIISSEGAHWKDEPKPSKHEAVPGASDPKGNSFGEGSNFYSTLNSKSRKTHKEKKKKEEKYHKIRQKSKRKRKNPTKTSMFVGSLGPRPRRTATISSGPPWTGRCTTIHQGKERTPYCVGRWRPKPPLPCTTSIFRLHCRRRKLIR
jgi:hypothetical protein